MSEQQQQQHREGREGSVPPSLGVGLEHTATDADLVPGVRLLGLADSDAIDYECIPLSERTSVRVKVGSLDIRRS